MIELPSLETLRLFRFWIRGEDPYAMTTVHRRLWPKPKPKRKIRIVRPEKVRNANSKSTPQKRQAQQGQPQPENHRMASR
jgi:hypothetical protein